MVVVTAVIFCAACLNWLYWVVKFLEVSVQPNGGLAAFAVLSPLGTATTALAVSAAGLAVCQRLSGVRADVARLHDAIVRMGEATVTARQVGPSSAEPGSRYVNPSYAPSQRPSAAPTAVQMDKLPLRLMVRAADGKLDELEVLLEEVRGDWSGTTFVATAIQVIDTHGGKALLIPRPDIRRVGRNRDGMTTDVDSFLAQVALAAHGSTATT